MRSREKREELSIKEILNILNKYKWSILLITLLVSSLSYLITYFKPSIYVSSAIMKVKGYEKSRSNDVINNTLSTIKSKDVSEEISLLKTYKINKQALLKVDFSLKYFKNKNYKKIEIFYADSAIQITNITIKKTDVINKYLTIVPTGSGFNLIYQLPYKDKIKQKFFNTNHFEFTNLKNLKFNEKVVTPYFTFTVIKKSDFSTPIEFKILGDKRNIFQKNIYHNLDVTQLKKDTSLIKVSFEDTLPKRANLYIDALINSFIEYNIENKNHQNSKTLDFITKELKSIKQELKYSEQKLELHQVNKNIVDPSVQASLYINKLSDIGVKISENKLKNKLITNLINFVQNNYDLEDISPAISRLNDDNTLSLISKLQNSQLLEEELSQEYTNEYPKLKVLRKQIDTIRHKIESNLKNLKTNIKYENTNLLQRKNDYEEKMKTLPSKERELVNLKRNYEVKSKMYEYLLKKQAENKIIQLATFSNYQVIDYAYNSQMPIKPKRFFALILGMLLGLLMGSILALFRHTRNNYIKNSHDIENITSLPIYGTIPYNKKQGKHKIFVHENFKSPFTEAYRTLRTNLQLKKENQGTILLITSTIAGEGKSTTVANLATILEMARYKTIVINFDLRRPSLHQFFDVDNSQGICNYLREESPIDDIIFSTEFANLDIIPSGTIPSNPSELMLSTKLPQLFVELKKRYDYILIDTAPIGIVSDTKILMQYSDLNMLILREDYAKKEFILTLEEMIYKHEFKNIGLILNASKSQDGEYGYGNSYEYA